MKTALLIFFVFYSSKIVFTQFFFFTENDCKPYSIEISEWRDLDLNDFHQYLESNDLELINSKKQGNKMIFTCQLQLSNPNIYIANIYIEFVFENSVINRMTKTSKFVLPNLVSITSSLNSDGFSEIKRIAEINDSNVPILFSKYYFQTMKTSDDISAFTDSSEKKIHYENHFDQSDLSIYRQAILLDNGSYFEVFQSEQVTLPLQQFFISGVDLQKYNSNEITGMVDVFLNDARLNGISFHEGQIKIEFSKLEEGLLGLSKGIYNDSIVYVLIDKDNWSKSSPPHRWYVLYHELGHDILNFEHGKGGRMMNPISDLGYSWSEFWEDRQEMFMIYLSK
jgi:hypothetical protein